MNKEKTSSNPETKLIIFHFILHSHDWLSLRTHSRNKSRVFKATTSTLYAAVITHFIRRAYILLTSFFSAPIFSHSILSSIVQRNL